MTNSDSGGGLAQEVILTIAREYGWPGPEPTERVPVKLSRTALERVSGRYEIAEADVPVSVTFRDNKLTLIVADQNEDELVPESETRFFLRSNGQRVEVELRNDRATALVVGPRRADRID